MTEVSNYPEMDIVKIVTKLDPDCPDPGAYVDGHCSIAELVLSSMKTPEGVNRKLLEALKMAFCKLVGNDDSIGWDELADIMTDTLAQTMGDKAFCEWVDSI